jgi:prophage maintenance system killer protein
MPGIISLSPMRIRNTCRNNPRVYIPPNVYLHWKITVSCMEDINVEQVIAFHQLVMKRGGGDTRILSEAHLHQMVFSANRIDGLYQKAAFAFFSLVAYPAFREGNSRTARLVTMMILNGSGYTLKDDDDMTSLVKGIRSFNIEQAEIEEWLFSHAIKISD